MPIGNRADNEKLELARLVYEKEKLDRIRDGLPFLYAFKHYKWSRLYYESKNKYCLCTAANQVSKALDVNTEIPTPSGFKLVGDLKVGDYVFGRDGKPTKIIDIPFEGVEDGYEFNFGDECNVVASINHDWIAKSGEERFRKCRNDKRRPHLNGRENDNYDKFKVYSTKEIIRRSGEFKPRARFSIPICKNVDYKKEKLFDPYLVGLIIGDGSVTEKERVQFVSADDEIIKYVSQSVNSKWHKKENNKAIQCRLNTDISKKIHETGLQYVDSKSKFIPKEYLESSFEDRVLILQGMMDTDGTVNKKGLCHYSTSSKKLAEDFSQLICSLGGRAIIKERISKYKKDGEYFVTGVNYNIRIWISFCPFKLTRKIERFKPSDDIRYRDERVIRSIINVGQRNLKCITVDNKDGSFLCTRNYIVTHNSSTQIRTLINWATNKKLWQELWIKDPTMFVQHLHPLYLEDLHFDSILRTSLG